MLIPFFAFSRLNLPPEILFWKKLNCDQLLLKKDNLNLCSSKGNDDQILELLAGGHKTPASLDKI